MSAAFNDLYFNFSNHRPQDQSGHKGVKKNPPSDTQDRIRVVQPVVKHFAA